MPQFVVTVKRLNKRSAIPVNFPDTANIIGEVKEGFSFEGAEADVTEVPNRALGKWYKDRDGHFYWGGGINEITDTGLFAQKDIPPTEQNFDPSKMSWGHKLYNVPVIWDDLKTKGRGTTIAVIDSGIDKFHADLKDNIHPLSRSFIGNETEFSDNIGHGTQMAGIIAASGKNKVYGIAPEAKLLILKATEEGDGTDLPRFTEAVNYALSKTDVDIISISYSFVSNNDDDIRLKEIDELKKAIQKALDAGKIVVASIGDLRISPKSPENINTFPACFNTAIPDNTGVLAVGSFDIKGNLCGFSNWNKHLCLLAPGDLSILTTGLNNSIAAGQQTSIAAAFTAGCLGLMISYLRINKPGKEFDCVKALLHSCDDIGTTVGPDISSGFGRMNFRNALVKIKTI